jgi:hypothetical protein
MFLRKIPKYIWDVDNLKDDNDLTQWCNKVWEKLGQDDSTMFTAVQQSQSPARGNRLGPSLSQGKLTLSGQVLSLMFIQAGPNQRQYRDGKSWCYYHTHCRAAARKCETDFTYLENK